MNRQILVSLALLLAQAVAAYAVPRITVGPHPNLPLTGLATLEIFSATFPGGGRMDSQTLYTIDPIGAAPGSIWGLRLFLMGPDLGGPYSSFWSRASQQLFDVPFQSGDPIPKSCWQRSH
jgi:hypothetical protein